MKRKLCAVFLAFLAATMFAASPSAFAQSSADAAATLQQYVAELQNSPDNQDLRRQIIQLVNSMEPKPSAPDQFYKLMGEASSDFHAAQSQSDYAAAVSEFGKASLLAPWVAGAYFDLGEAQENAGQHADAVQSFQLYLLAAPNAKDHAEVEQRILEDQGAAEADSVRAARASTGASGQSSSQNQETQQQSDADFIASLNGARYRSETSGTHVELTIQGNQILSDEYFNGDNFHHIYQIEGKTAEEPWASQGAQQLCIDSFGNTDCKSIYYIHQDYIEMDTYDRGTKVPDNTVIGGGFHCYAVYKRVQ